MGGRYTATCCSVLPLIGSMYYMALRHENAWDMIVDDVSRLCVESSNFVMETDAQPHYHRMFRGAVRLYVESCLAAWTALPDEQKATMRPLMGGPLPVELLMTEEHWEPPRIRWSLKETQAELRDEMTRRRPRDELLIGTAAQDLLKPIREYYQQKFPQHFHLTFPYDALELWHKLGVQPSRVEDVDFSEVPDALRHARVVRFDLSQVVDLPYNKTIEEIGEQQGQHAEEIPVWTSLHSEYSKLSQCRKKCYDAKTRLLFCEDLLCRGDDLSLATYIRTEASDEVRFTGPRISPRRLPRFLVNGLEEEFIGKLGLEGVQRTVGQVNVGANPGHHAHWDEQDNLFIQITAPSVVLVISSNFTDAAHGAKGGGMGRPVPEWMALDPWTQREDTFRRDTVPFYLVYLQPGQGVTIPSRSYHQIISGIDRVAMNVWLEPQFNKMMGSGNPRSFWHTEAQERRALRNLWVRALGIAWDKEKSDKKRGLFYQNQLEFI